jgi:glycosyltransferase involved in cell wall biosynthesis
MSSIGTIEKLEPRSQPDSIASAWDKSGRPIKVLHVTALDASCFRLEQGGIEKYLLEILRSIDRSQVQMDLLVWTDRESTYSEELQAFGVKILVCPPPQQLVRCTRQFARIVREHGPYDIVHSHTHHHSGVYMALAALNGVKERIVHSHMDTRQASKSLGPAARLYREAMRKLMQVAATGGLATSGFAAADMFPSRWNSSWRWTLQVSTSDLTRVTPGPRDLELCRELDIPDDAWVIGHVGRFSPEKNHPFLLNVFRALSKRVPNAYLVCVGGGPEKEAFEALIKSSGLESRVRIQLSRKDIGRFFGGLFDVFVFPSLYEGLGMVAIEAQAAGVPVAMSDAVPPEAVAIPDITKVISLKATREQWADEVIRLHAGADRIDRKQCYERLQQSPFNIERNAAALLDYYKRLVSSHSA